MVLEELGVRRDMQPGTGGRGTQRPTLAHRRMSPWRMARLGLTLGGAATAPLVTATAAAWARTHTDSARRAVGRCAVGATALGTMTVRATPRWAPPAQQGQPAARSDLSMLADAIVARAGRVEEGEGREEEARMVMVWCGEVCGAEQQRAGGS